MKRPARRPLRLLIVEDSPLDAELIVHGLRAAGIEADWQRVDTEDAYVQQLDPALDVILSDFNMPAFGAFRALDLLRQRHLDVPFIVVSGSIGEDTCVQLLKSGATDYLLKDRLGRLGQAVERAIDQRRLRRERQETEARMRFAMEAASVGVWEIDYESGAVAWSELQERLHGLAAGTFAGTVEAVLACVHPDDRDSVRHAIDPATIREANANVLYRTQSSDGTTHWLSFTGRMLDDSSKRRARAAGVCMDVTEQHVLEEQYRQAQKMEAVGQLAGGVAHDFNNLLMAIDGYAELVGVELDATGPLAADVREIRRAAARAARLTQQLLAFSRRQVLAPRVIDLRTVIVGLEPMLRRLIPASIEIVIRGTTDSVGFVTADPGQVEQVLLNLAVNARDAMPDGGTLIVEVADVELDAAYVRQHPIVNPGRHVMMAVTDSGLGMDAETQARIFDPFFTTKELGKGTGLGLSTVFGIVKQSGGNVWVYSEPGKGSTFKVYLPRVDEPLDQPAAAAPATHQRGSETILVVEDDDAVRALVCRVLERGGYKVHSAATPELALEMVSARRGPIDLLLTDLVLPQMSGRVLFDRVAVTLPQIAVLFMSGYTPGVVLQRSVLEDGMAFLQKPMTPEGLTQRVREVLDVAAAKQTR